MDDSTSESNSRLSGAYYHMLPEKYTSPKKLDHHGVKFHSPLTLKSKDDVTLVEDGMYWSNEVINNVDPGLDDETIEAELRSLRSRKVKSLEQPTWLKCGREQNRFVTFKDGVHACARYREPHNQLVLGEVMSFYLARLLGIHNVPAVILSQVKSIPRFNPCRIFGIVVKTFRNLHLKLIILLLITHFTTLKNCLKSCVIRGM